MALLDGAYFKVGRWLWINTGGKFPSCEICASGRKVYPIKGRIMTRFLHRVDGVETVCKSPWSWRGRVANGKMKVE